MGFIADLIQIVQTLPQWGVWFLLFCALLIVLVRNVWKYMVRYVELFNKRQKFNHDTLSALIEGARIKGTDPPKYAGFVDILERLDQNKKVWESYPNVLLQRCLESDCPHHKKIEEHTRNIEEGMERWHRSAQKSLDQFTTDAAIARAETQAYVKGINEDVRLLSEHTLPLIERIVQILSRHEQGEE